MSRETAMAALTSTPTTAPALVEALVPTEATPAPVVEPAKDLESSRLALFAKKEAAIVRRDEELKKREALWKEEQEKFKPLMEKGQKFEQLIKEDAVEALRLMGLSDAQILNTFAKATEEKAAPTPEELARAAAQDELKKFKDEQAEKEAAVVEERHKHVITQFKKDINKVISSEPEKFEYCNYYGSVAEELIHETVARVLEESKGLELISTKEAAELVENYYEEQDKAMSSLKKRNPEKKDVQTATQDAKEAISKLQSKTLTNKVTATTAATTQRAESRAEKRERLENMLRNGIRK